MIDRIEQLEQEARAAVDAAADTDALEDVRIRYLGRKAELPNLLRGVAQLPPERARRRRQGRQRRSPGPRSRRRGAASARSPRASSSCGWCRTAST